MEGNNARVGVPDAKCCQQICSNEKMCKFWTWIPGDEMNEKNDENVCHLKNRLGMKKRDCFDCESGPKSCDPEYSFEEMEKSPEIMDQNPHEQSDKFSSSSEEKEKFPECMDQYPDKQNEESDEWIIGK